MIAAAVVVLAVGAAGGGWYVLKGSGGSDGRSATQQGDTTQPLSQALPGAAPQAVSLSRAFERITPLVDKDSASAAAALDSLSQIAAVAMQSADSDVVQFRYLRSKAMMNAGDEKAGCDSLYSIEGKLPATRFKRAGEALIKFCKQ